MNQANEDLGLIRQLLESYDQKAIAEYLNEVSPGNWCRETINRWLNGKASPSLSHREYEALKDLLPSPPKNHPNYDFDFIDLFAGIGGIRRGFEQHGGRCVFTSECNAQAVRTYKANHYSHPEHHRYNDDIRKVTLSDSDDATEQEVIASIQRQIPDHDVLLACLPSESCSVVGIPEESSLGNGYRFKIEHNGKLFFDVARILETKRPAALVIELCKYLVLDDGKILRSYIAALEQLGYWVSDADCHGSRDPKMIDSQHFTPQQRERIVLVGFRKDLDVQRGFTLADLAKLAPKKQPKLADILDDRVHDKFTLHPTIWAQLLKRAIDGTGVGFKLVGNDSVTCTLTARYYMDSSLILVDRGLNQSISEFHKQIIDNRPRRLTPRECARIMGYDKPGQNFFRIPVSDTQAYKKFGSSSVVPVFAAIAELMKPRIAEARQKLISPDPQTLQLFPAFGPV